MNHSRIIVIWLLIGCALIWGMVVVGGITRLTGSGLSMAKWKISSVIPPLTDEEWQKDFNDYKQTPQYKQVNSYFTLEDYKHIYWWEFIHRLIGRMIGMVFIIPFAYFLYKGQIDKKVIYKLLMTLTLLLLMLLGDFVLATLLNPYTLLLFLLYGGGYFMIPLGIFVLAIILFTIYLLVKRSQKDKSLMLKFIVIFFMGGLQGTLGWIMVTTGMQDRPQVSHYFLAAHLITAFITFGYSFWVALDLIYSQIQPQTPKGALSSATSALDSIGGSPFRGLGYKVKQFHSINRWTVVLLFFVLIQIIYGAFTSGLHAGQFDPTWPKMGNSWIAPEVTAMTPVWRNFIDGVAGVQFIHRYNAYMVVLLVFIIWYKSRKLPLLPTQKHGINFLLGMVTLQFLLGILTLIYSVPVVLGVLHQTGAFLLFASTIFVLHQWKLSKE